MNFNQYLRICIISDFFEEPYSSDYKVGIMIKIPSVEINRILQY